LIFRTTLAALAALAFCPGAAPAPAKPDKADWRTIDPENLLVIDTTKGRILIELRPDAAPLAVERVKLLTREKLYDGLAFHRVIDWFMAQTGDPGNVDGGKSSHPDLKPEFTFRRDPDQPWTLAARPAGNVTGFVGTLPFQGLPDEARTRAADKKVSAWALHCPGVVGMGRGDDPNSANAEFYLMRQSYPALDKRYTVFGRVVSGLKTVRRLKTGEPVKDPDLMTRVRVAADLPAEERPTVEVPDNRSARFAALVEKARSRRGADFSPCDVEIPARVR
jgi:peptidylprolyl isomerase